MNVTNFLGNLQKNVAKNAPTVLTVMGGVGVIASVFMARKSTLDAQKALDKKQNELQEEAVSEDPVEIPTKEKVIIYAKAYAPTIAMVVATEVCLYQANHINQKRIAAISAAYILKEANFKEYKEQVETIVGSKKAQEIKDSLLKRNLDNNVPTDNNIIPARDINIPQLSLWFDTVSKRYFYSNAEIIRKAAITATEELQSSGYVSLNRVYELLGMEGIYFGDDNGWSKDITQEVIIEIGHSLSGRLNDYVNEELMGGSGVIGTDIPIGLISMEVRPSSAFFSEV